MVECQKLKPMLLRHQLLQQIISVAELFDQILQANSYFSCFCTSFLFISQHQTENWAFEKTLHLPTAPEPLAWPWLWPVPSPQALSVPVAPGRMLRMPQGCVGQNEPLTQSLTT